jgi:hypothetical protein
MADLNKQDLIDAFKTVFPNSAPPSGAAGGAAAPKTGNFDAVVDKLTTGLKDVAGVAGPLYFGFQRLTTGADVASIALTGIKDVVGKIPGLGGMSAEVIQALIKSRDDLNKSMAETGIGNNNLGQFIRMSGEAGLTTQQFNETMKGNISGLVGLGSNATKSADAFSKVQKELIQSTAGQELSRAGIGAQELAQYTALSITMSRNRDASTTKGQQELAASAATLGREIDATSRMTGQSREEIAKSLKTDSEKADNILAMNLLTDEQRKSMTEFNTNAKKLGPAFTDILQENLSKGAVVSQKNNDILAMYGPAGQELLNAQRMAKEATDDAGRLRAKQAEDAAVAHLMEFQNSTAFAQNYSAASDQVRAAVGPAVEGSNALAQGMKKAAEENGGYVEGMSEVKSNIEANQAGLKDGGKAVDENQQVMRAANEANIRATMTMGALAGKAEEANTAIGKSPAALNKMYGAIDLLVGKANQGVEGRKKEYVEGAGDKATNAVSNLLSGNDSEKTASPSGNGNLVSDSKGGYKPRLAEGGIVEPKAGGTEAIIGEGGKSEAVIPLDRLKDMMGGVATQISSATTPAGGSSVTALDNKQYLEWWKQNYQEQTVIMTGAEQRQAQEDIQRNQERISEKTAKIKELTDIAATRELTDEEQKELRIAERRKARAEQNLASDQARLTVLQEIDKGGLANQAAMAEQFIAKQAETKQIQEQVVNQVTEGAKEILKVNGKVIDPNSPESKAVMSKVAEGAKEILKVNGKVIDPNSPESKAVMSKVAEAKDKMSKEYAMNWAAASAEERSAMAGGKDAKSSSIGNVTGSLGGYDPFHPVIKDQKAADEQKAKIAAQKADLAKKEESKKKAEEQAAAYGGRATGGVETVKPKSTTETAETKKTETTLKDLNDQLIALNKHMMQLISHNREIVDHTKTTARKDTSGQRLGS